MPGANDMSAPDSRHIVLAGGGHAHALLVRHWRELPRAGTRVTLISPADLTPYSGMLPGLVAGHYSHAEIHINIAALCRWAGVTFRRDTVTGLDPDNNQVQLASGGQLSYDVLSLNTGSVPEQVIPGVAEHAVPVKPISGFWPRWQAVLNALQAGSGATRLAVVGGGAGSLELCLAMAHACRQHPGIKQPPLFSLLTSAQDLLPEFPARVRRIARQACMQAGIEVFAGSRVTSVTGDHLKTRDGHHMAAEHVFWCTQAAAPAWLVQSGLACDPSGFVTVNPALQSTSHDNIFAAGDIADMIESPRSKAGVFPVRQAPVLRHNLLARLTDGSLQTFSPQRDFLAILALGAKQAVASRGRLSVSGHWVWHWKHRIDQKFIRQFRHLP